MTDIRTTLMYNNLSEGSTKELEDFLFTPAYHGVMISSYPSGIIRQVHYDEGVLKTEGYLIAASNIPKKIAHTDPLEYTVVFYLSVEHYYLALEQLRVSKQYAQLLEYIMDNEPQLKDNLFSYQVIAAVGNEHNWHNMTHAISYGLKASDHMEIVYGKQHGESLDYIFVALNSIARTYHNKKFGNTTVVMERLPFAGSMLDIKL